MCDDDIPPQSRSEEKLSIEGPFGNHRLLAHDVVALAVAILGVPKIHPFSSSIGDKFASVRHSHVGIEFGCATTTPLDAWPF